MKTLKNNKGFTLIELVVVIVILGILAATAAPKFIDLTGDARASVVEGVQGSVNSAINLAYSKALVENQTAATGAIQINGEFYDLAYGYPTLAGRGDADGTTADDGYPISELIELSDGSDISYAAGVFSHDGATTPANCSVTYADATINGQVVTPAAATIDTAGC